MTDRNLTLLLRRATAELRAFLGVQREQIDAIAKYAEAQNRRHEPTPPAPSEGVRNEVDFPPEVVERYYSEQNKTYRIQRNTFWISIFTLIALAVYTVYTIKMYSSNKEAADAATSAANTAANTLSKSIEQFRIDERAWIEIERIERTQVSTGTDEFGAAFRYRLYPKNVGKTEAHSIVASAARSMQGSISLEANADNMTREQDSILLNALPKKARDNPVPRVLAPGATAVVPFVLDGQEPQRFSKDEWVSYLIGRIDYADDFGVKHWMKFCFYVGEANGNLWNCHEGNDEDNNPEVEPTKKR